MYKDLITYCDDVTGLMAEVEAAMPERVARDEAGNAVGFLIDKTPTVRKGNKTLSVVRCTADEVAAIKALKAIRVIAEVDAGGDLLASMSNTGRALYDAVHDRTPVDILDDAGNVIGTSTPPELIGAFA